MDRDFFLSLSLSGLLILWRRNIFHSLKYQNVSCPFRNLHFFPSKNRENNNASHINRMEKDSVGLIFYLLISPKQVYLIRRDVSQLRQFFHTRQQQHSLRCPPFERELDSEEQWRVTGRIFWGMSTRRWSCFFSLRGWTSWWKVAALLFLSLFRLVVVVVVVVVVSFQAETPQR